MRIDIVTLFPAMVEPALATSMLGRARASGLVDIHVVNLRDYATGKHRVTDDYQFGGGGGMVLKPEPIAAAVEALRGERSRVILMDPRGRTFSQAVAGELARETHLILVAGRYEGVDERVSEMIADERLSIGDYVLTGGEGAAERESFAAGLLEPPQYTRPEEFRGARVPEVLLSGDHARVARWRREQALWLTWRRRPELLAAASLTDEERRLIEQFERGEAPAAPARTERDEGHGRDSHR